VTEPPKVKTIPADDRLIWSIKDFPEWHFGGDAPHPNISEKWREKHVRAEDIPHFPEIDLDEKADKSSEPRPLKAAYTTTVLVARLRGEAHLWRFQVFQLTMRAGKQGQAHQRAVRK
jgi:hypothetical protein